MSVQGCLVTSWKVNLKMHWSVRISSRISKGGKLDSVEELRQYWCADAHSQVACEISYSSPKDQLHPFQSAGYRSRWGMAVGQFHQVCREPACSHLVFKKSSGSNDSIKNVLSHMRVNGWQRVIQKVNIWPPIDCPSQTHPLFLTPRQVQTLQSIYT